MIYTKNQALSKLYKTRWKVIKNYSNKCYGIIPETEIRYYDDKGVERTLMVVEKNIRLRPIAEFIVKNHNDKFISFNYDEDIEDEVMIGGYLFRGKERTITSPSGEKIQLKKKENDILIYLYLNINKRLNSRDIIKAVWGIYLPKIQYSLAVRMTNLRKILKEDENVKIEGGGSWGGYGLVVLNQTEMSCGAGDVPPNQ